MRQEGKQDWHHVARKGFSAASVTTVGGQENHCVSDVRELLGTQV